MSSNIEKTFSSPGISLEKMAEKLLSCFKGITMTLLHRRKYVNIQ